VKRLGRKPKRFACVLVECLTIEVACGKAARAMGLRIVAADFTG